MTNNVQINVTAQDNTAQGLGSAEQSVSSFGQNIGGILAGAGAAAGALLVAGVTKALDQGKIVGKLGAQLGATPAEAEKYGKVAGQLYADGITTDVQGAADTIQKIMQAGLLPTDATDAQLKGMSTKVADLATTFDEDLGSVTNAVSQLMRTGLAKNADEAFDIITKGMQSGANKSEDFLDTINEYSVQFKRMGIDGATATGLISQGLKGGARDADQVADALGQFGERALAGGTAVDEAYASIGLSADEMAAKLGQGGKSAEEALTMTLNALHGTKDEQVKLNAAAALFGDPANVMGDSLYALDPATAAAASGMDKAKGATDKLGNALRDNAGAKLDAFKRKLEQKLVNFLGDTVIPALADFKSFVTENFSEIWTEAGKGSDGLGDQIVNAFGNLGEKIKEKLTELLPKIAEGLAGLGEDIANYITENPMEALKIALISVAIITAFLLLPALIAAGIGAVVVLIVAGFVKKLIEVLTEKLPEWWDAFTEWLGEKADSVGDDLEVIGEAIGDWFSDLWDDYVAEPVGDMWDDFIGSIKDLPDRIKKAASGMWDAFKTGFKASINAIIGWWNNLGWTWPSVEILGTTWGGGSWSTPNVPFLARGGLASGMALVGERGPELVNLPNGSMVRSTEDSARLLGGGGGGGAKYLNLDVHLGGSSVGRIVVDLVRGEVRRQGGNVQATLGQ